MSRPDKLPRWATDGGVTLEPSSGQKDTGWSTSDKPPARMHNWLWNRGYRWMQHLDEVTRNLVLLNTKVATLGGSGAGKDFFDAAYFRDTTDFNDTGTWVAIGQSGQIQTSQDLVSWTERTPAGAYSGTFFGAGVDDAGLFCIVGNGSEIQTSPNGITWTARAAATGGIVLYSVAHDQSGLWVLVGAGGEIETSPDGITWTKRTPAGSYSGTFWAVAYGNGLWVAVGSGDEVQTSPDGITWTARSFDNNDLEPRDIHFHNGLFVAVGGATSGDGIQTSTDGVNWTQRTLGPGSSAQYEGVTYHEKLGLWIVISAYGFVGISQYGDTWELIEPVRPPFGTSYNTEEIESNADGDLVILGQDGVATALRL